MINLSSYRRVRLTDVAAVERVKKNKVYAKGTVFIQVSASKGQTIIIDKDMQVDTKYVSVIPHEEVNPHYLKISIANAMTEFREKNQTGLNIQVDSFNELYIHIYNKETQEYIVNAIDTVNKMIEHEEKQVENLVEHKRYYVQNMFV